ncbi:anosmin-1 [Belonocnema kinseyi]|uniref:anosmin-1 n=1 Tax=Belonocnema kinseyi TaxID=2817044 RepID=UPI00143CCB97|nr:anosmin-1 [Belonocnema kinseyi]
MDKTSRKKLLDHPSGDTQDGGDCYLHQNWTVTKLQKSYVICNSLGWWPWWLLLPGCLASWTKFIKQYDSMRIGRCMTICGENYWDNCIQACLESNYTKSGHCPGKKKMTIFEAACLRACEEDFECPSLAKCCENECGINCMYPTGLEKWAGLPAIPSNVRIRQRETNLIILSWNEPGRPINDFFGRNRVSYVIEERYVLGPWYLEHRLTSWALRNVSTKPHATLEGRFKRGHWYQFRVAAINEHGSRGYSQPSRPLMTKGLRKPKEPRNFTLVGARVVHGKLRLQLRWHQPFSDAPIQSYKVYWSRLVQGSTNTTALVHHRTLPQDKICHEVKGLDLDSQYILQVQAIAVYGSRRLASLKSSRVFNSTNYMKFGKDGLRVRKMKCLCGEIKAYLAWTPVKAASHYNITWGELTCKRTVQVPGIFHYRPRIVSEITKETHYEIPNLRPGCTYNINIQSIFEMKRGQEHAARIELFASGCHQRRRNGNLQNQVQDTHSRCKIKSPNIRRSCQEILLCRISECVKFHPKFTDVLIIFVFYVNTVKWVLTIYSLGFWQ